MNLYLLTWPDASRRDEVYQESVVAAPDVETARRTHPISDVEVIRQEDGTEAWSRWGHLWGQPGEIIARLIGTAAEDVRQGTVIATFYDGT